MSVISIDYEVDLEAEGDDLILQNIANILRTVKGEIPLGRDFGIDGMYVDKPLNKIEADLKDEIVNQITTHETGVEILSISFTKDINGINPIVEVSIIE